MTDSASPQTPSPLELDRVQSSRPQAGEIRLRLSGRWVDPQRPADQEEELLVVNVEGRRHRFPVSRDEDNGVELPPGRWSATFTVPAWAEPREEGQAALWLGNAVIPVPPMHQSVPVQQSATGQQSGPVGAGSESVVGASGQGALESTLAELRSELDELRAAVQDQHREMRERSTELATLREQLSVAEANAELRAAEADALREELTTANVSRQAAVSEAAGLRSELERIGSELAVTRERADTEAGDLAEANRLLADARALAQEMRATHTDD